MSLLRSHRKVNGPSGVLAWLVALAFVLQLLGMAGNVAMAMVPIADAQAALDSAFAGFPICSGSADKKMRDQQASDMPCRDHFNCPICQAGLSPLLAAETPNWLPVLTPVRVALITAVAELPPSPRRAGYVSRGPPLAA